MNINELEPGPETDRLVIEALGPPDEKDCVIVSGQLVSKDRRNTIEPSNDLEDAFWAAEQAGVFEKLALLYSSDEHKWSLWNTSLGEYSGEIEDRMEILAETPAMAICKAILKLKE